MVRILMIKQTIFKKIINFYAIVGFFFGSAFAMQQRDGSHAEKMRMVHSLTPLEHRIVPVQPISPKLFNLILENSEKQLLIDYQWNGQSIARLLSDNQKMHFESDNPQQYNFSVTHPIETETFVSDLQGNLTFKESVKVTNALLKCHSFKNGTTFTSHGLTIDTIDKWDNKGQIACSDLLYKGKQLNNLPDSSLTIQGSASFFVKGLLNVGKITCSNVIMNAWLLDNMGILNIKERLHYTGKTILNNGTLNIGDCFIEKCEKIINRNRWNVHNDCFFEHVGTLTTNQNTLWHVKNNWKGNIKNLYVEGTTWVENLALFNVESSASLNGTVNAHIFHLISNDIITCNCQGDFFVTHHLGLKAKGWIECNGNFLERAANSLKKTSKPTAIDKLFPEGIFLHSEQSGICKSGTIISKSGTVSLSAGKGLTHTGLTEAGFHKDATLLMSGESLTLEKKSIVEAFNAKFLAQEQLLQQGKMQIAQNLLMSAPSITQSGSITAGELIKIEGKEFLAEIQSKINTNNLSLLAEKSVTHAGTIEAEALAIKAPSITFESQSNVTATTAALKADETLSQEGNLNTKELAMRAKFLENSGNITADNAHFKADRWWLNTGGVTIENGLTVDALLSMNMLGWIQAKNLTINAGIDLNLFGAYKAQNAHINALVGLSTGVYIPQLNSWDDLFTFENLQKTAECGFYLLAPAPLRTVYATGKALYNVPGMYQHGHELYAKALLLGEQSDVGVSDWIPLICGTKDLLASSVQLAKMGKQMCHIGDASADSSPKTDPSSKISPESQKHYIFNHSAFKTASSVIGAFGPHLNRETLLDMNAGLTLGINGYSRNLVDMRTGGTFFANNYTLDTCIGVNRGALGATNLRINASRTYSSTSPLATIFGHDVNIEAKKLEMEGKFFVLGLLALKAQQEAYIAASINANHMTLDAKEVLLQKECHLHVNNAQLQGEHINSAAQLSGKNFHFQAKDIRLEEGSTVQAQEKTALVAKNLTMERDSQISSGSLLLSTASFQADRESHLSTTDGTTLYTQALDNQGSIDGKFTVNFMGTPDQFKNLGHINAQQNTFEYHGPIRADHDNTALPTADELVDGEGNWGKIINAKSHIINTGKHDIHLKKQHTIAPTLTARTEGNLRADESLKSEGSLHLNAEKNMRHNSLKATGNIERKAGIDITAESTSERIHDGQGYQDILHPVTINAGQQLLTMAGQNINQKAVTTSSGKEGSLFIAGGTITDEALSLEHYKQTKTERTVSHDTYITPEVVHHTSQGDVAIIAKKYAGEAPIIDAKNKSIHAPQELNISDVHDVHIHESEYQRKFGWLYSNKENTQEVSSTSRGAKFLGEGSLTFTSPKATVTNFQSNTRPQFHGASLELALGQNTTVYSKTGDSSNPLWNTDHRDNQQHCTYTASSFPGMLQTDATEVSVQVIKGKTLKYLDKIQANGGKIHTIVMEEINHNNAHTSRRLTKGAKAVLALSIFLATKGVGNALGASIIGSLGVKSTVASAVVMNMSGTAVSSLSFQAAQALIESNGDIKKAAQALASTQTLKSVILSSLASGLMGGADQGLTSLGLPQIQQATNLGMRLAYAAPRELTRAGIRTGIDILTGQNPADALLFNSKMFAATTLHAALASQIGDAYGKGTINGVSHKLLHAGAGAVAGGIIDGKKGAMAGSIGAFTAELSAELFAPSQYAFDAVSKLEDKMDHELTREEFLVHYSSAVHTYLQKASTAHGSAQLVAATSMLLAGLDPDIGNHAAITALDNNFVILIGAGIFAASTAYSCYNLYKAYDKEGIYGFCKQLGIEVVILAGGVVAGRVGGLLYPSLSTAISAGLSKIPGANILLGKLSQRIAVSVEKMGATALGKAVTKAESTIIKYQTKALSKLPFGRTPANVPAVEVAGIGPLSTLETIALHEEAAAARAVVTAEKSTAKAVSKTPAPGQLTPKATTHVEAPAAPAPKPTVHAEGHPSTSSCPPQKKEITIYDKHGQDKHIFKNEPGHIPDTPENRKLIIDTVLDKKNYVEQCKRGTYWYEKILPDGKQVWVAVRDDTIIRNAGINEIPRIFDKETGFLRNIGKK